MSHKRTLGLYGLRETTQQLLFLNDQAGLSQFHFVAEQRMRDRIAASAREKLSQVDKEKQLQAERKRKAAMFINLLKSNNTEAGATEANEVAMGRWTNFKIC